MADDEFVWLRYPANGNKSEFPAGAADIWRARGWVDTDPDPDPSIWRDSPEQIAAAKQTPEKTPVVVSKPGADADDPLVLNPGADAANGNPDVEADTADKTTTRTASRRAGTESKES